MGVGVVGAPYVASEVQAGQELVISHDGSPFLYHWSRIWELDSDGEKVRPLFMESGFWYPRPNNEAELLLTHSTGNLDTWHGKITVAAADFPEEDRMQITRASMRLETDALVGTASGRPVEHGIRHYGLVEGKFGWLHEVVVDGVITAAPVSFQLAKQA